MAQAFGDAFANEVEAPAAFDDAFSSASAFDDMRGSTSTTGDISPKESSHGVPRGAASYTAEHVIAADVALPVRCLGCFAF